MNKIPEGGQQVAGGKATAAPLELVVLEDWSGVSGNQST